MKYIRGLSAMMLCMVKVCFSGQMEEFFTEIFIQEEKMEKEFTIGRVAKFTKASLKMINVQVREHYTTLMAKFLSALGRKVKSTVKDSTNGQTEQNTTSCILKVKNEKNLANSKVHKSHWKI